MIKVNLPTKITIARIALLPFMIVSFLLEDLNTWFAIVTFSIFAIASATDFVDGKLARARGEVTTLGKFLDPIADKLLVILSMILLLLRGYYQRILGHRAFEIVFLVIVLIIVARELIISAFRQIAASKNIIMQADMIGKVKTFETCFAIGFSYLINVYDKNEMFGKAMAYISFILWCVAVILTIVSGIHYIVVNKIVLKDN